MDDNMSIDYLLLDFGTEPNAIKAIKDRLTSKEKTCEHLKITRASLGKDTISSTSDLFQQVDASTRIYILAHGEQGFPEDIYGYSGEQDISDKIFFNYKEVSQFLANRLDITKISREDHNLTLSLIVCFAGVNEQHFDVNLHRDLAKKHGLKTDLLARTQLTTVIQNAGENSGKKVVRSADEKYFDARTDFINEYFKEWVQDQHQKPGTKSKLTWNSGGQAVIVDAYIDKFFQLADEIYKELLASGLNFSLEISAALNNKNESAMLKIANALDAYKGSSPSLQNKIDKISRIAAKYNSLKSPEENLLNFRKSAILASDEMLSQVYTKSDAVPTLKKIARECQMMDSIDKVAIKQIVSSLKSIKPLTYQKDTPIPVNLLNSYQYARRLIHPLSPIETKILNYNYQS